MNHKVHRGIIVLKKEKNTENTEKKEIKTLCSLWLKKSGG